MRFRLTVLVRKALLKSFDVLSYVVDKLDLIFRYSTSDLRPHEECVEFGEHAEHLVRVACRAETVAKA